MISEEKLIEKVMQLSACAIESKNEVEKGMEAIANLIVKLKKA